MARAKRQKTNACFVNGNLAETCKPRWTGSRTSAFFVGDCLARALLSSTPSMSTGIWSAASGAVGQIAALDSAAQNIANATTPGFRAEEAVFRQTLVKAVNNNTGTKSLRYAVSRTTVPDFRAGQMVQTGRPLDVAITDDKSFFMVSTPRGERYTRAGSFRMALNGNITTPDGYPVLGANHRPVKIDPNSRNVSLDREGRLIADGVPGPELGLVTFKNLQPVMGRLQGRPGPSTGDGVIRHSDSCSKGRRARVSCVISSSIVAVPSMTKPASLRAASTNLGVRHSACGLSSIAASRYQAAKSGPSWPSSTMKSWISTSPPGRSEVKARRASVGMSLPPTALQT